MASITPGTGGSLKSTTLETVFHEVLSKISLAEQDPSKNTQAITSLTFNADLRTSRVRGTFSFKLIKQITNNGSIQFVVAEHLTNTGYSAGTGGTLKSIGLCAVLIEIAELILNKEQLTSKNPSSIYTIKGLNYDPKALVVSGYFDYQTIETISPLGDLVISGKTYLLD